MLPKKVSFYQANHFNLGESGNESINIHKRCATFGKFVITEEIQKQTFFEAVKESLGI